MHMDSNQQLLRDLEALDHPRHARQRPRRWLKFLLGALIFLGLIFVFFYVKNIFFQTEQESWIDRIPLLSQVKHLAESADRELKGEERDRINILLLGIGGKGHDGGQLTDTIIGASLKPSTKQVAMLSIPRDLAVPIEGSGYGRINAIAAYAEQDNPGSGGLAASQAIGDLLDEPMDYYVRVDFKGFEEIIDEVGGVDVYVEQSFDDYSYPILGREDHPDYYSRYEHLQFDEGWQHMDGSRALKYARSRHGTNGEGSDFARARRQQKIITAARDKVLSTSTLLNPGKLTSIISKLSANITTNLKVWEIIKLWGMVKDIQSDTIVNKVLDNSPSGLLVDGRGENGAYLLSPRSGDFSEIQYLYDNIFGTPPAEKASLKKPDEDIKVSVFNGTWVNGLGGRKALDLEEKGVEVVEVANSTRRNFEKSVIYDLTYGAKRESLEYLKKETGANIAPTLPDWLKEDVAASAASAKKIQPDFILILGTDADVSGSGVANEN